MNHDKEQIMEALYRMRRWDNEAIPPSVDTEGYIDEILSRIAPLAERLGMRTEQTELENLVVKLGYPDDYVKLKQMLLESEMSCEMVFRTFALPIRAMLDELGIQYEIKYRMKSVYSVWRKMRVEKKRFDDVYDLFATRIIYKPQRPSSINLPNDLDALPEVAAARLQTFDDIDAERFTCWRIYTIITTLYRIQHDRIKNWITHPKPSGYQALHLTVMGPGNNWIEIQIRSERMNFEAEHGLAAHWRYKQESDVR